MHSIRRSSGMAALRSAMARWISMAQRTASTALANSTSAPSPVVLTMRPAMLGDLWINEFAPVRLERRESAFLVYAHQPAVAGDIGGEDGGEPPFHQRRRLIGEKLRTLSSRGSSTKLLICLASMTRQFDPKHRPVRFA